MRLLQSGWLGHFVYRIRSARSVRSFFGQPWLHPSKYRRSAQYAQSRYSFRSHNTFESSDSFSSPKSWLFLQAARVSALIYTVVNKEAVRDTTPCLPVRPSRGWTLVAFRNRSPWRPINRFGLAQAAFAKPADCCIGIASACCLNGWSKAIRRSGAIG